LPESMPDITSERFLKVEKAASQWELGTPAKALETKDWSTHEWLHFIQQLPDKLSQHQMRELDEACTFTHAGTAEILAAWFGHAIRNEYEPAYGDRKSTRLNSSHVKISYAVLCL